MQACKEMMGFIIFFENNFEELQKGGSYTLKLLRVCRKYYSEQNRIDQRKMKASHAISVEHFSPAKLRSTEKSVVITRDCLYCASSHETRKGKNTETRRHKNVFI